jgi:DNA-directed RNA polymerase subunit RPC12/RpoP
MVTTRLDSEAMYSTCVQASPVLKFSIIPEPDHDSDCGVENEIKPREPIRCKACGHRIMYKKRTSRSKSATKTIVSLTALHSGSVRGTMIIGILRFITALFKFCRDSITLNVNGLEFDNQRRDIRDEWRGDKTSIAATNCGIGTDKMARQTRVVYFQISMKHRPKKHRRHGCSESTCISWSPTNARMSESVIHQHFKSLM